MPRVQGPSGASAPGRPRNRSASGQAAAKARRTRLAVSMTRAAILISRSRKVANSALARSRGFGNGVADGEHQPISGGVQHEADLIGDGGTAGRAIGSELRLVQLDQVLGLAARAIEAVVDPFGRAVLEVGDDEADVEAERRGFDAGDGAPLAVPGFGLVARLGIAAHDSPCSRWRARCGRRPPPRRLSSAAASCRAGRRRSRRRCSSHHAIASGRA